MQTQEIYEERLCAFVDILGFCHLVRQSTDRPALQDQIRQLLREVVLARPVWDRDSPVDVIEARLTRQGVSDPKHEAELLVKKYAEAERGASFSDTLILSATLNDHAVTWLVTSLLLLTRSLAELGTYVRGAVCLGKLHHEQDLCFGPVLIDAIDLEKHVACFPRIIFTREAYAAVAAVQSPSVGPLAPYLREDFDSWRFLDFLNRTALDLDETSREDQMLEIRRELDRQLSSSHTPNRVRQKLLWLARYFNSVLEEGLIVGIDLLSTAR